MLLYWTLNVPQDVGECNSRYLKKELCVHLNKHSPFSQIYFQLRKTCLWFLFTDRLCLIFMLETHSSTPLRLIPTAGSNPLTSQYRWSCYSHIAKVHLNFIFPYPSWSSEQLLSKRVFKDFFVLLLLPRVGITMWFSDTHFRQRPVFERCQSRTDQFHSHTKQLTKL